jgi:hypothetical protein
LFVSLTLSAPYLEILRHGNRDDDGAGQADLAFVEEEHGFVKVCFNTWD